MTTLVDIRGAVQDGSSAASTAYDKFKPDTLETIAKAIKDVSEQVFTTSSTPDSRSVLSLSGEKVSLIKKPTANATFLITRSDRANGIHYGVYVAKGSKDAFLQFICTHQRSKDLLTKTVPLEEAESAAATNAYTIDQSIQELFGKSSAAYEGSTIRAAACRKPEGFSTRFSKINLTAVAKDFREKASTSRDANELSNKMVFVDKDGNVELLDRDQTAIFLSFSGNKGFFVADSEAGYLLKSALESEASDTRLELASKIATLRKRKDELQDLGATRLKKLEEDNSSELSRINEELQQLEQELREQIERLEATAKGAQEANKKNLDNAALRQILVAYFGSEETISALIAGCKEEGEPDEQVVAKLYTNLEHIEDFRVAHVKRLLDKLESESSLAMSAIFKQNWINLLLRKTLEHIPKNFTAGHQPVPTDLQNALEQLSTTLENARGIISDSKIELFEKIKRQTEELFSIVQGKKESVFDFTDRITELNLALQTSIKKLLEQLPEIENSSELRRLEETKMRDEKRPHSTTETSDPALMATEEKVDYALMEAIDAYLEHQCKGLCRVKDCFTNLLEEKLERVQFTISDSNKKNLKVKLSILKADLQKLKKTTESIEEKKSKLLNQYKEEVRKSVGVAPAAKLEQENDDAASAAAPTDESSGQTQSWTDKKEALKMKFEAQSSSRSEEDDVREEDSFANLLALATHALKRLQPDTQDVPEAGTEQVDSIGGFSSLQSTQALQRAVASKLDTDWHSFRDAYTKEENRLKKSKVAFEPKSLDEVRKFFYETASVNIFSVKSVSKRKTRAESTASSGSSASRKKKKTPPKSFLETIRKSTTTISEDAQLQDDDAALAALIAGERTADTEAGSAAPTETSDTLTRLSQGLVEDAWDGLVTRQSQFRYYQQEKIKSATNTGMAASKLAAKEESSRIQRTLLSDIEKATQEHTEKKDEIERGQQTKELEHKAQKAKLETAVDKAQGQLDTQIAQLSSDISNAHAIVNIDKVTIEKPADESGYASGSDSDWMKV